MDKLYNRSQPLLIAHRGAPVHAPENTFASFQLALDCGADILETDLWFSKDGVIICHHDRTVDRVTNGSGAILEMTLDKIKMLRVKRSHCSQFDEDKYPNEEIPTLQELLDFVPADAGLGLELKDPLFSEPERAAQLIDIVRPRIEAGTLMLLSFDTSLLWVAREVEPSVWIGELSEFNPNPTFGGNGVATSWLAMKSNPHYIKIARQHNLWVCPLDPMPEDRLSWYLDIGVDAVLTDHPDVTRAALARLEQQQ